MSVSSIYILDNNAKPLIYRIYRGDSDAQLVEKFGTLLKTQENSNQNAPIFTDYKTSFSYVKSNDLYFLATTSKNSNIALTFCLLYKIIKILKDYVANIDEESIKDNFVIIYELLDEMVDYGYPQSTEAKVLKQYIMQNSHQKFLKKEPVVPVVPTAVTEAVSWRCQNIQHKRNEIFLDVIESVNLLANSNGSVVSSDVIGVCKMKVFLSGMPELRLGLNDKVLFDKFDVDGIVIDMNDVRFHQCVRLPRFYQDRTISFIPPDGEFELMSYRVQNITSNPIFSLSCSAEKYGRSRLEYLITIRSKFKTQSCAQNVVVTIPLPCDVDSPVFHTAIGSIQYVPELNCAKWSIRFFASDKEYIAKMRFKMSSVEGSISEDKKPISVKFEIPYFTTSGLHVRYLKIIEKSGYQALSWVRYYTQNGDYLIRT